MADRLPTSSSSGRRRREDASIGDFVIGGEIGKGSFAQVYSGHHKVRPRPSSPSCILRVFVEGIDLKQKRPPLYCAPPHSHQQGDST